MKLIGITLVLLASSASFAADDVCTYWQHRVELLTKSIDNKNEELKNCKERCHDLGVLIEALKLERRATSEFLAEPFFGCR